MAALGVMLAFLPAIGEAEAQGRPPSQGRQIEQEFQPQVQRQVRPQTQPGALRQVRTLVAQKASRTPAQKKISSHLLGAAKERRGEAFPAQRSRVGIAKDGTTLVDIKADVTPALLDRIQALGGTVINAHPRFRAVRARMPLVQIEALAELPEVQTIRPADEAITR